MQPRKFLSLIIIALPFSYASFAQEIWVGVSRNDAKIAFGIKKIKDAAAQQKWKVHEMVTQENAKNFHEFLDGIPPIEPASNAFVIQVVPDSTVSRFSLAANLFNPVKSFAGQCYAIRINKKSNMIYVFAGGPTGAMYGALDIAEAIASNTLGQLTDSDHEPYLKNRGIKFNIPLDLRSPTYSDPGDAFQQNIPNVWDLGFWQTYFDEMAIHRYNVMTWWSLQPFPSMVKIPEFPGTSLDDVWRTKEKYDESFSNQGRDFDRAYLFNHVEVVKKITIDEKIIFWKKVMQLAADRGIDIYLFTWNLFTYGAKGIPRKQDNDTTIAWYRAAVREMIKTYPLLRGIGITAGEGMENNRKGEYANEKWLWKTYGEGIRDGLKNTPDRKFSLIHRSHWASLNEIQTEFKELPCNLTISLKYAIAHMYAIPNPPFILPAMPLLSKQTQTWLTIRNDDIYSFRWANNDYARSFIKSIPEIEKIAGFYMGPDGYCWGRDYLSKQNDSATPPLIMQKQWYSFMLWGRLSYDPDLPDKIFLQHLPQHFPSVDNTELMKGWSAASMIFPWITRFVWGDLDLKWFPEANTSHPTHKGFYTVKDYAEREPMEGSNIESILSWVKTKLSGAKTNLLSPLDVADSLETLGLTASKSLQKLPKVVLPPAGELQQTLSDIEAFGLIGMYYGAKIRAACSLALFDSTHKESYRRSALLELKFATQYWNAYAKVYSSKNKPVLYNRVGYVDVEKLKTNVLHDIDIVRDWKPGMHQLKTDGKTEVPFKQ